MSVSAPTRAASLARVWVRFYTRGLPAEVRTARQAEIDSDLWEHEQWGTSEGLRSGRTAIEIAGRLLVGMKDDLSWRALHRTTLRQSMSPLGGGTMNERLKRHGMDALAVALGVWATAIAPILIGSDDWLQVAASVAFGLLILGGLIAVHRGFRGGRVAVAVGAIGTGLMSVWLVLPPLAAVVLVIWLLAKRDLRQVPPLPA